MGRNEILIAEYMIIRIARQLTENKRPDSILIAEISAIRKLAPQRRTVQRGSFSGAGAPSFAASAKGGVFQTPDGPAHEKLEDPLTSLFSGISEFLIDNFEQDLASVLAVCRRKARHEN